MPYRNRQKDLILFGSLSLVFALLAGGLGLWIPPDGPRPTNAQLAVQFVREVSMGFAVSLTATFVLLAILALLVAIPRVTNTPRWYRTLPLVVSLDGLLFVGLTLLISKQGVSRLTQVPSLVIMLLLAIVFFCGLILALYLSPLLIARGRVRKGRCGLCAYPLADTALRISREPAEDTCPECGTHHISR